LDPPEVRQFYNFACTIPEGEDVLLQASLKVKDVVREKLVGYVWANFRFRGLTEFELARPTWDTGQMTIRGRVSYSTLASVPMLL
jgi:hypothetical protein